MLEYLNGREGQHVRLVPKVVSCEQRFASDGTMGKSIDYRLKVQHCLDMAERANGPLERACWLIVADSWTHLLHLKEEQRRSAQLMTPQDKSAQINGSCPFQSNSISFSQFSLIDRQMQPSPQVTSLNLVSLFRRR
jgi:hypothetical protein